MTWEGSSSAELLIEERRFLQGRVARFGLFASGIFAFFLVYRIVMITLHSHWEEQEPLSFAYHALGTLAFFTIWLLCRAGEHSARYTRWVESIGLLVGAWPVLLMGNYMPLHARPDHVLLFALTFAMFVRSVYVPSTALRTITLGCYMGCELVVALYLIALKVDLEAWAVFDPVFGTMTRHQFALSASIFDAGPWWLMTIICTGAASQVIYGLRRDVRNAKQLGQYHLVHKIGEGGMGMVFEGHHSLLRRPSAVKLLLPEKAGTHSIERFEREVRLMAKLRHPNTVTVFDYGRTPDGVFYYAMELIDGATLLDVVKHTGPMESSRVLAILTQVSAALVEAHGIGLIHRDIKPANIMVFLPHTYGDVREASKILDFGLVKETESSDAGITQVGAIAGTPQYMAPESIRTPEKADARSDLYALGCVGFYMLTGEHLFDADTAMDVCAMHLNDSPQRPSERLGRAVPADLEGLIMACLQKQPEQRPQTARELKHRLEQCTESGQYSANQAQGWWEEYGALFEDKASSEPGYLTIDLARALSSKSSGSH